MTTYDIDTIQTMIDKDLSISRKLLELLKQETPSIQNKDYDSVKKILLDKAPLLDQLKKHADIRKQWLLSLYKVADENHWKDFLSSFNNNDIEKQWKEVNSNIEECKTINESNGILISRGQKTYSQLLTMLRGGVQDAELYTAKGQKKGARMYNSVAKA